MRARIEIHGFDTTGVKDQIRKILKFDPIVTRLVVVPDQCHELFLQIVCEPRAGATETERTNLAGLIRKLHDLKIDIWVLEASGFISKNRIT